jgi:hypothetical protein
VDHVHPLADLGGRWRLNVGLTAIPGVARWFNTYDPDQADPWTQGGEVGPFDHAWEHDGWAGDDHYLDAIPLADWHEVGQPADDHRLSHWLVYVFARG